MSSWRNRCLQPLAAGADTPRRTAATFALGVFLSFSPFLGLQIVIALAAAYALRLSRPMVLIGLCANLPWIMVPWYLLTTAAGARLLGLTMPSDLGGRMGELLGLRIYSGHFWQRASDLVAPFFWALIVGSTVGALVLGAVAYFAAERFLTRVRLSRMAA